MASSTSTSCMLNITTIMSVLLIIIIIIIMEAGGALAFKCSSSKQCNGLVGYVPRNGSTTLSHIQTMFGVPTLHSLLGANNLSLSTPSSYPIKPLSTINIPFRCKCNNGKGMPLERVPMYTVKKDDGLWHIAAEVFSGLVTFQQIQDANDILDANKIEPGQKLWIPLPCSCDQLDDQNVLHYGHVVKSGSTIEQIAEQYGTTNTTLLQLNDLPSSKSLLADTPLDVPLKACASMVETNSLDYPLLIGSGTYAFTAEDCVMCKCDAATNNWTLQCEPSSSAILVRNSSSVCPFMQCQGGNLYLGNATSSSSSCNHTTCSYAGYTNQTTILTTLSSYSTCAVQVGGALAFKCSSSKECNGLVGYVPRNGTTLSHIQTIFGVRTLHSLLGANNLPLSTPSSYPIKPLSTINIPFRCKCNNGKGMPLERVPMYTMKKDDGLRHIAAEIFSGLVTVQQIQDANDIQDENKIEQGQKLWIPLPCSCDQLDDQNVLHYGHVVKSGSTIEQIAEQYGTTNTTLLRLNDLPSSKALLADTPLDVPLKACTSMVETNSLDYPLLIGNGTYSFTAGDCVMCKCDAATNNWTLQCEPSSSAILARNSSSVCPSMQCQGGNLYLGNATSSSSSSCNHTTCSYAGYTNQTTILTTLSSHSTCAVSDKNRARKISMQGWTWGYLLINLMVLCLRVVQ